MQNVELTFAPDCAAIILFKEGTTAGLAVKISDALNMLRRRTWISNILHEHPETGETCFIGFTRNPDLEGSTTYWALTDRLAIDKMLHYYRNEIYTHFQHEK